ncbi:MAG: metallophosphoesterase [Ruminococcus sp.]|nr:metallophosphoesterase [Ruminococcus sp.]
MIYITGDKHGDISFFKNKQLKKLKKDDYLIITGDFGFLWDNSREEKSNLEFLKKQKYNILFLDGTHENFDILEKYPVVRFFGAKAGKIADNIFHLMRGQVYIIEKKGIFTFGGGISRDLKKMLDLNMWFERELPTKSEFTEAAKNMNAYGNKIDYIITHEPPAHIKCSINPEFRQNIVNTFLDQIASQVTFEKWFFGSVHIDDEVQPGYFAVFNELLPANKTEKPRKF